MIGPAELSLFESRYLDFEAQTADQLSDWISKMHAGMRVSSIGKSKATPVARVSRVARDDVALVLYQYNAPLQGQFEEDFDAYFICLPISGASKRICPHHGELVQSTDHVLIYRGTAGLKNYNSADYTSLSLVVPAADLERHLQTCIGREVTETLAFSPTVDVKSAPGRAIVSLASFLLSQFNNLQNAFADPASIASMKSYLATVILTSLPHNYSDPLNAASSSAIPRAVKRAETYMRERCADAITIDQLAQAAGCSPRALHAAFKTFRGATPMSVLCDVRLEAAHREILQDVSTVTEIASKYGFSNAGRFAKQYAQKFGQKPSLTRLMGSNARPISINTRSA